MPAKTSKSAISAIPKGAKKGLDVSNALPWSVKRQSPKFRAVTLAIRNIRKQQKRTQSCVLKRPMKFLVTQIASNLDASTWLRKSTIIAVQVAVEGAMQEILTQAADRRVEGMSKQEKKKQASFQVMAKNIEGSFKVWASNRGGDFQAFFDKAIKEENISL